MYCVRAAVNTPRRICLPQRTDRICAGPRPKRLLLLLHFNYKTMGVCLKSNLSSGMIHSVSLAFFTGGCKFFILNCFSDFNLLWQWNGLCSKASNQTWHERAEKPICTDRRVAFNECVCKLGDTTFAHCCMRWRRKKSSYTSTRPNLRQCKCMLITCDQEGPPVAAGISRLRRCGAQALP